MYLHKVQTQIEKIVILQKIHVISYAEFLIDLLMYRHINVLPRRLGSLFLPHQFQPTSTGSTSSKMAENQGSGADKSNQGKEVNAVHDDAIWRQLITHELEWARNWQHKWGFMIDAYEELVKSIFFIY